MDLYVPSTGNISIPSLYEAKFNSNLESLGLEKLVDTKWVTVNQIPVLGELTGLQANAIKVVVTGGEYAIIKIYDVKKPSQPLYRNILIT